MRACVSACVCESERERESVCVCVCVCVCVRERERDAWLYVYVFMRESLCCGVCLLACLSFLLPSDGRWAYVPIVGMHCVLHWNEIIDLPHNPPCLRSVCRYLHVVHGQPANTAVQCAFQLSSCMCVTNTVHTEHNKMIMSYWDGLWGTCATITKVC